MAVLTRKEFEQKKSGNTPVVKSLSLKKEEPVSPVPLVKNEYELLHPENGVESNLNFIDYIIVEGKKFKRECVNGIVRTVHKELADFLLKKGYHLLKMEACNE